MTITFNDPNRGSTFGNLFSDTNFTQDTWYRLWTGNEDGTSGHFVDTSRFYGEPGYEAVSGNGWIMGKDLYQMEITFAQAGHTHLWVRNFEETQNLPQEQRWIIGEMDFSVVKDHQVDDGLGSDDSINPGQTGPFIREEVTDDTSMLQMFNIGTLTDEHWIRLWVGNEEGTVGEFIDTSAFNEYGKGWIQSPDLEQLMFEAPELGESVELWVTTWTEENKYADWKHWTVTTVETDPEDLNPGATFTLTEAYDTEDDVTVDASDVQPVPTQVLYWGDPEGNHVPADAILLGVLQQFGDFQLDSYENFDFLRLLEQIENITDSGVMDDLQGGGAIGWDDDIVEVVDGPTNNITVNADGTVTVQQTPEAKAGDYTGDYQIIISMDDANTTAAQITLTQMQFEQFNNLIFDADGNSRLFVKEFMVYPQVPLLDSEGDEVLDINGNEIPVDLTSDYVIEQGDEIQVPIVLTPTQNNEGTLEEGFTGDGDDTIVAGRLELLHQAYIDAGAGHDTLEIDAKGYYAQPLALLNIEDIKIQNLPNVYTITDDAADVYDISEMTEYPDLADGVVGFTNSVIDLSRATAIETLTITEGDFEGLEDGHVVNPGTLTVTGIRNGAETTLDGGFANNLKLNFSADQGSGVNLVFNNLSMEFISGGSGNDVVDVPLLKVAHNAETLNVKSTGGGNFLHHADLGGQLNTLNISGDAHLYIAEDLDLSFHDGTPVTINAATNTGGVNLTLSGSEEVTFTGSKGNDRFDVTAEVSATITGGTGNNAYYVTVGTDQIDGTAVITNSDGNNYHLVDADVASITVGNGNNEFDLTVGQTTIVAGDGDNVISAEDADAVVIEAGDGNNEITTDGSEFVDITLGAGDNQITSVDSEWVVIEAGDGSNMIQASAEVIDITTGAGDDLILVSGEYEAQGVSGAPTALLMIDTGAGENTVVLGRDYEIIEDDDTVVVEDGITALEGSSITGENITLLVDNPSDLRAAELSGITSVVLNDDVSSGDILTLTASQFAAIGAENFSVDGGIFHTHAYIKIIAEEDISLADMDVDSLPANIDLYVEINDGVTVTMTAEQLHKWVAEDGVILADDGNFGELSGSVLITNAGLDFDPFNSDDQVRTEIDGTVYKGGSLSEDFWNEDADDADGIQRDEWGSNVLVDRVFDGYNRPADSPSYSRLTIDTDNQSEIGPFATIETFLRVIGDSDLTFTPVEGGIDEWGRPIEGGSAIELGIDNGAATNGFMVDFSSAAGDVVNLTLANFENADAIYGNGNDVKDVRVNVELGGQVGAPGLTSGLTSSGVQTYVVTDIDGNQNFDSLTVLGEAYAQALTGYIAVVNEVTTAALETAYADLVQSNLVFGLADLESAAAILTAEQGQGLKPSDLIELELFNYSNWDYQDFYVCTTTKDLEVLGLQGNGNDQIHFKQVDRGVTFLMETEYNKFDGYVVGRLNVDFARAGATGVIDIVNTSGDLAEDEHMSVNGINLNNAKTADISISNGDVVIDSMWGESLTTLDIDAVGDVTFSSNQDLPWTLTAIDVSDVVGEFSASFNPADDFTFIGAQGGSELTLTNQADENQDPPYPGFVATDETSIDGGVAGMTLALSDNADIDLTEATLTNISTVDLGNGSSLTISMPDADLIGAENFILAEGDEADLNLKMLSDEPFAIENYADGFSITITIADQPEVTLSEDTDLTGIDALVVHEGTVLNLTAAQFQQLGTGTITGVDADGVATTDYTVNITDLYQADLEGGLDLAGVTADTTTITLAESVELDAADNLGDFDVVMGDEMTLALYLAQAAGLNVSGGLDTILQILDIAAADDASIDASGFDVGTLMMLNVLAAGFNVDNLFYELPESVTKLIYNGTGWVEGVSQYVTITEGTTVPGMLAFTRPEADTEIRDFYLTLEGGTEIDGDLNLAGSSLENDSLQTHLQTVTINSYGTEGNLLTGETANVIDGDITSQGTDAQDDDNIDNNLLNLTINADQDLEVSGDVIFESVTLDDIIIVNDDDEAVATLTVNGTADVSFGALDTSDDDVDALNVVNNSTGTLSFTLDADKLDDDDELSLTGGNIEVTVEGDVNLSDDDISGVSQITIGDAGIVTLTQAQYELLGAANLLTDGTDNGVFTLNLVDFDGTVPFDATLIDEDITVATITMAAGDQVIDAATDLSNVGQIIVPEGGTLTLTAAQFQQLNAAGTITVLNTDGDAANDAITVNITGLTQADVDADGGLDLSAIDDDADVTLTLAEDVNLADDTILDDLARLEIILADGQTLGLENSIQADGLVVIGGTDTTLVFQFAAMEGADTQIDASGYGVSVLKALANFVNGENVEFLLLNVPNDVEERYYVDPEELGFVSATHRVVVVEAGVTVDGYLMYNDPQDDREVRTLNLTLEGDATIDGDLNLSTIVKTNDLITRYFDTLTINSEGDEANVITGDVIATGDDVNDDVVELENNLLNVVINADQDLEIGGNIVFTSVDADDFPAATLTLTGDADVTVTELDLVDDEIDTLTIAHNGTGTFTATGGSPGLDSDGNLEELILTGTGNLVFGTVGEGITADGLSSIDASGLSGNLDLGEVDNIDDANFEFIAGTGVTTLELTSDTLDADVVADPADTGWSFDFSNAAAGSVFELGDVTWTDGPLDIDLGANTTLVITEDTDWTNLDLTLVQTQDIVLGEGVELLLTAQQANLLNIVPDPAIITDPLDPDYDAADVPVVNIVGLGEANYDFSGIDETIAGTIHLVDDDVTAGAGADLGAFSVTLIARDADDFTLTGQTIRFQTEEQAAREILVVNDDGDAWDASGQGDFDDDDNTNSTNVVWLFDSVSGPVDTSEYDANVGRVWFTPELVNGANVEDLFNTLPDSILRVEFSSLEELDVLLTSVEVHRTVELVAFTDLGDGLTFSDQDRLEHVASLTIQMGGQVNLGDLAIDNVVEPAAGVAVGAIEFDELIINSHRALSDAHYLAPEGFDNDNDGNDEPGEHVQPANINVVGDIAVGAEDGLDLLKVTLNTLTVSVEDNDSEGAGADLQVGTITFDAEDADSVALLTVTGANDTTIAAVNTDDPEIVTLTIDNQGTGTVTITGASAAAAVSDTETLNIDVTEGGTVNLGTADDPDKPGVSGADLSLIDVDGAGDANLGVISLVDGVEPVEPATWSFKFDASGSTGTVTATLGADSAGAPELEAGGVWQFLGNGNDDTTTITLTGDVVLGAGDLSFDELTLIIDGDVDFTTLNELTLGDDDDDDVIVIVPAGSSLTLLAEDAHGLEVHGDGEVIITELEATPAADLSGIMTADGDTGTVEVLVTTDAAADVNFTGDLGKAHVTVSGDGIFDVTVGDLDTDEFDHDDDDTTDDEEVMTTFTVEAGSTLELAAGQVDDRVVDGGGNTELVLNGAPIDVNLSLITTPVVNAAVNANEDFDKDADFGTAVITVADTRILTVIGETVDGQTILGEGTVLVDDADLDADGDDDAINADFSNFGIENITFVADALVDTITFPALYGDPDAVDPVEVVQTVTLTSVQADGQVIVGATPGVTGAVLVNIDDTVDEDNAGAGDGDVDAFDLSDINAGTMTATIDDIVDDVVVFDPAVDFGLFDIVITAGDTVTMTAAQADGLSITETGNATIIITDLEDTPDADLSGIVIDDETAQLDANGGVDLGADLGEGFNVMVTDSVDDGFTDTVEFTGAMVSNTTTFTLGTEATDNVALELEAADASFLTVFEGVVGATTAVIVNNVYGDDGDPLTNDVMNLGNIAADTMTAYVPGDVELDPASTFGNFNVVFEADGTSLTLSFAQMLDAGATNVLLAADFTSDAVGGDEESIVVTDFNPATAIDTSVLSAEISMVLHVDDTLGADQVLAGATNLSGVEEIVIPDGVTLTMTADQFQQIQASTTVTGDGTLNLTGFGASAANFAIDLSSVEANAGTISLDPGKGATSLVPDPGGELVWDVEANALVLDPAAVLDNAFGGMFGIVMTAANQAITLSSEIQADGRSVTGDGALANTRLILGFTEAEDTADLDSDIDASGFDVDNVHIINQYLANEFGGVTPANIEQMLTDLADGIPVTVYDVDDALEGGLVDPDAVSSTTRTVNVEPNTLVDASVAFNDLDFDTEVTTLTINLNGSSIINGNLTLPQGEDPMGLLYETPARYAQLFDSLTINSDNNSGAGAGTNQLDGNIVANTALGGAESYVEQFTIDFAGVDISGTEEEIEFAGVVIDDLDDGDGPDEVAAAVAAGINAAFGGGDQPLWYAQDNGDGTVTFTALAAGDVTDVTVGDFTFTQNDPATVLGAAIVPGDITIDQQGSFEDSENNLLDVNIVATHNLDITGTIEFSYVSGTEEIDATDDLTTTAALDVSAAGGVTVNIGSVTTTDVHITGLVFTQTGAGTVNVPGLSPGAALGNTETLTIDAEGTVNLGTEGDDDRPGVSGADLSLIDVNGDGAVNLGVIALADSVDFELDASGNTDKVTATLGGDMELGSAAFEALADAFIAALDAYQADPNYPDPALIVPAVAAALEDAYADLVDFDGDVFQALLPGEGAVDIDNGSGDTIGALEDYNTWTFTGPGLELDIAEGTTLGYGTLSLDNVALTVSGDVDFTDLAVLEVVNGATITIPADQSLTVTVAQALAGDFLGAGSLVLVGDTIDAADLIAIDGNSAPTVDATAIGEITGTAVNIAAALTAGGIDLAADVDVTVGAGVVAAADLITIDANTTALVDATAVTGLTGTAAEIAAAISSATIDLPDDLPVTVAGDVNAADLLTIDANTTAVVDATGVTELTGTAADIADAISSAGIDLPVDVPVTVDAGVADAADLNTIDANTTAVVDATAVTELTGTAADIADAISSAGINTAADVDVTVDAGAADAADLNTIDTETTAVVDATAVTELTGTAAAIATAISSADIDTAANVDVTVDAGVVAAADLNTIAANTVAVLDATAVTELTGTAADIAAAIGSAVIDLPGDVPVTVDAGDADAADLDTIDTETTAVVDATAVIELTGAAADIADAISSAGIDTAVAVDVTVDAGVADAADLNTIDNDTTAVVDAALVTELTGTAAAIATAISSGGIDTAVDVDVTLDAGDAAAIADINTIDGLTTAIVDATAAASITGTATLMANMLVGGGVNVAGALNLIVTDQASAAETATLLGAFNTGDTQINAATATAVQAQAFVYDLFGDDTIDTLTITGDTTANQAIDLRGDVTTGDVVTLVYDLVDNHATIGVVNGLIPGVITDAQSVTANGTANADVIDMSALLAGVTINALGGNDTVTGSAFVDEIDLTGGGNNTVNGSQGADVITAGAGTDIFTYTAENQFGDEVTGFGSGVDKVRMDIDTAGILGAAANAGGTPLTLAIINAVGVTTTINAIKTATPVSLVATQGFTLTGTATGTADFKTAIIAAAGGAFGTDATATWAAFGLGVSGTLMIATITNVLTAGLTSGEINVQIIGTYDNLAALTDIQLV